MQCATKILTEVCYNTLFIIWCAMMLLIIWCAMMLLIIWCAMMLLIIWCAIILFSFVQSIENSEVCIIFIPPDRVIGSICFVLSVCLYVCLLSTSTFNINFWTERDRDFIFGMCTQLMIPFPKLPGSMTLNLIYVLKITFLTLFSPEA